MHGLLSRKILPYVHSVSILMELLEIYSNQQKLTLNVLLTIKVLMCACLHTQKMNVLKPNSRFHSHTT